MARDTLDVGVVVAWGERHVLRFAERVEPFCGAGEFRIECDVHEVAGQRDVVRLLRMHVAHNRVEHLTIMVAMPLAIPVDEAEPALVHQLTQARRLDRSDVRV